MRKELSKLLLVNETYFSSLFTTNFDTKPLNIKNIKKIKNAIIISVMLLPPIPDCHTSLNKFKKFCNTSIIIRIILLQRPNQGKIPRHLY